MGGGGGIVYFRHREMVDYGPSWLNTADEILKKENNKLKN